MALPTSPEHAPDRAGTRDYLLGVLALAVAYALAARFGLAHAVQPYVTLIWPPTGIAVAVLCRAGLHYWPGVFLGVLLTSIDQRSVWLPASFAVGNTLGPVVAAALLRRLRLDRRLTRASDVCLLVGVGAALAMLVPPTFGVLTLRAVGALGPDGASTAWLTWYLGDTLGVVLVAPILLTLDREVVGTVRRRAVVVSVGLLLLMAGASVAAFADLLRPPLRTTSIFPPYLLMLVVGLVQSLRLGMLHVLIFATAASAGTAAGSGPFASYPDPQTRVLMVWASSATAAVIVLILTTLTAQRNRVMRELVTVAGDYAALVEDNPAMICRFAPDGTIRYVNDTLERFFGLPHDQWAGRNVFEFFRTADHGTVRTMLAEAQEMRPLELVHDTPRGERTVRWAARKVRLPDGALAELHAIGLDVTAERRAEDERRAIEAKLVETQRLEALGVLSGGIAHDFNNILTGVLGHTELAAGLLPPEHPAQAHLATVKAGASRAATLVRQLLAYSGKGRFLSRPLSLDAVVRQTADLLGVTIPRKVELLLALDPAIPTITADESQLQQVVMNLVTNAGEAIGEAGGTITISTAVRDITRDQTPSPSTRTSLPPGRYVELSVADTGCGMDEATKARLFDPFFTTKFTGRGLGLSAVLGIIRAHHGTIRVESKPGVGSRFTILFPADAPAPPRPPGVEEPTPAPTETLASRPPTRGLALVVDDDAAVRSLTAAILAHWGYEVAQAEDGRQALDLFASRADEVRLVLLDLMMPVMDGAEALAEIRDTHPHVPVVLCSAYTADSLSTTVVGSPTTTFLRKPFHRRELRHAIATVCGGDGPTTPTPPAAVGVG